MTRRPRQKRYAPKVRSGCITCRKRRVKCDERQPACHRCEAAHKQCEGYNTPIAKIFEPINRSETSLQLVKPGVHQPNLYYGTMEETRSLQYYFENIAFSASTQLDSRHWFWSSFFPQAAQQCAAVRHAITAVALADEAIMSNSQDLTTINVRRDHHYNASISLLIQKHQPQPLELLLLSCIMLWVVGWYQRDIHASYVHISSAKKMIEEYKRTSVTPNPYHNVIVNVIEPLFEEHIRNMEESFSHDRHPQAQLQLPRPRKTFNSFLDAQKDLIKVIKGFSHPDATRKTLITQLEAWHESFDLMQHNKPSPAITAPTLNLYRIAKRCAMLATAKVGNIWQNVRLAWILKQLEILIQTDTTGLEDGISFILELITGRAKDWESCIEQAKVLQAQFDLRRLQVAKAFASFQAGPATTMTIQDLTVKGDCSGLLLL